MRGDVPEQTCIGLGERLGNGTYARCRARSVSHAYRWPMKRLHLLAGLAWVSLATGACTTEDEVIPPTTRAHGPASPESISGVPGHEVRAASTTMETWALLYEPPPWKPGQEVKVVWRSTGTGDFRVVAVGPRSREVPPVSGPTPHFGSNWSRPGDEWGTVFRLDEPGQWLLRVERGSATASLPVEIAP